MANVGACHGRILILGHSFVSRLQDVMEVDAVEVCEHSVMFCGVAGATVGKLRTKLNGLNLGSFCAVYLELGTNHLCTVCNHTADIVISDIWGFVESLLSHGARQVIFGEVLFCTRRWVRGPLVQEFRRRVRELNGRIDEWMRARHDVFVGGISQSSRLHISNLVIFVLLRKLHVPLICSFQHCCIIRFFTFYSLIFL